MFALQLTGLAACLLGGVVIHHWLARRWFGALESLDEQELLMHGLLASVIINGTVGTYLAMLHLFYPAAFIMVLAGCMLWLRDDTRATFQAGRAAIADLARQVRGLRPLPILALCGCLFLGAALLAMGRIPTANIDAWVFQLPLAFSVIEHHGFVHPLIGHPFYSHQPLFVNVLFAQALAIEPHFMAAAAVNVLIYLFTLISLAALCRQRSLALVLLLLLIGGNSFLATGVPVPLTDMPRSCLSVLGLTCAATYASRRVPYHAALAAMCIGAAIATKFTELVSLLLFGALLLPALRHRTGQLLVLKCAAVVTVIASYWYLKNLILMGNPLYPFLFGHPGLSDAWMADYMTEMTRAFDPTLRHLNHNLLSAQGWRDFAGVMWSWIFADRRVAVGALLLSLAASAAAPRRILPLLGITVFLFAFWYVVMFNHIRWAIPAFMMLYVTGIFALLCLLERFPPLRQLPPGLQALLRRRETAYAVAAAALLVVGGLMVRHSPARIAESVIARLDLNPIIEPVFDALRPGGIDQYLASTREGYSLYRLVTQQNLRRVLQPYDNGVKLYAAAYNGGRAGDWFVDILDIPAGIDDVPGYIARHQIGYFITRPDLKAVETERLGPARLQAAGKVIDMLKPGAQLLLEDANGWRLYRAGPAGAK
jgi:hypothetical protein